MKELSSAGISTFIAAVRSFCDTTKERCNMPLGAAIYTLIYPLYRETRHRPPFGAIFLYIKDSVDKY